MPHALAVAGVAFNRTVGRFEASIGDLRNRELLVVSLFGRDERSVWYPREVDQVSLELGQVNVQGIFESEGCGDGRCEWAGGPLNIEVT